MSDDAQSPASQEPRIPVGQMPVKAYGKYYLVRKLAEGGMAEIFLAKQVGVEGFERNVVIKRMLPHLSGSSDFVSMFLDEARLAASLAHPNIVQISDLGFADGCYFICMEYLAGEDFSTVLRVSRRRNEATPMKVVLRVLAEAAVGLHFAHEAVDARGAPLHLVHRDVSPSNILVTYSGQVKVLDFGIAKAESRITNTTAGVVKGKYQYMSPEQAQGEAVDRRSDIFSLGISLYEALTGVRPFARDTDLGVLKAVLAGDHQPVRDVRPDLPIEIAQIVERAMAHAAADRYPTALAFAHDIEKFIGATTSATGGQELSAFMTAFFGPERVATKTRVPSLDELSRSGVDVPGRVNPLSPKTEPGAEVDPQERTNAIGAPLTVRSQRRRQGLAALAGVVATAGLMGAVLWWKLGNGGPTTLPAPEVVVLDAGAPVVTPPVAVLDAGTVAAVDAGAEDAGAEAQAPLDTGPVATPHPTAPVVLTIPMVQRGLTANKARLQRCFRDGKGELPSAQGTLNVNFTIVSSGKVSSVTTSLPGTKVSACIERVMKTIHFPRHVDREVRVPLPLSWDVR